MKFHHTIKSFSILILCSCICCALQSQDLEEVIPRKIPAIVSDAIEEEPIIQIGAVSDEVLLPVDASKNVVSAISEPDPVQQELKLREEQLGLILRHSLYQKLTVPRWAKVLSADSWRKSFLKWRYFAQLADYVNHTSLNISNLKENLGSTNRVMALKNADDVQDLVVVNEEEMPETEKISQSVEVLESESLEEFPNNEKEDSQIEEFDQKEVAEEPEPAEEPIVYSFSIEDLTLSDSIMSEASLYKPEEILEPEEEEVVAMVIDEEELKPAAAEEPKKEEPKKKKEEKPITKEKKTIVLKKTPTEIPVKNKTEAVAVSTKQKDPSPVTSSFAPAPQVQKSEVRKTVTQQFAMKYGKLQWPLSNGRITDKYGYRHNAAERGLKKENYGIDISAASGSQVKAVYGGTVLMTLRQAPYDYIVTIKHGDYTTAYYFLDQVNVKVGDQIGEGEGIGVLRQNGDKVPFHFEIWQGQERVNPEPWLQAK